MITISGGVISRQAGSTITYKAKCDSCQNVEPNETTVTITKGVTEISTFRCSNCGKYQITKIKHANEPMKNVSGQAVLFEMGRK
jgi:hypothetical protein